MSRPVPGSGYARILSKLEDMRVRKNQREFLLTATVDRTCREIDHLIQQCRSGVSRRYSRGPCRWKELRDGLRELRDWLRWHQIPDLLSAKSSP